MAWLSNLRSMLGRRYKRTGEMDDLGSPLRGRPSPSHQAVSVTSDNYLAVATALNTLGNKLGSQYERTGMLDDLNEAIRLSRQAVEITPCDHPDLASRLNDLGCQLGWRYERTGKMDDLEEAIRLSRQAVEITPSDHPDLANWLSDLGIGLQSRYEQTGKMEDLEEAIRLSYQAVKVTPDDHPYLASRLNNLGSHLGKRYERTGKIDDLNEAIRLSHRAVGITPSDHPALATWLNNLGSQLGRRYERTGKMDDLDKAIRLSRQAVKITPNDHPALVGSLSNLGTKLESRYKRTGKMEDLEEAIRLSRQAVKVTPDDHPYLASRLNNLSIGLESRYERTGKMDDLEEAIQVSHRAVEITPSDHPDLATWLNNLGTQLESRYTRKGKMDDLNEAIRVSHRAVKITPSDHPDLATWLNNLGNALGNRYEGTGKIDDLEEVIRVYDRAAEITPSDHPNLGAWLNNLGNMLGRQYERTGKMDDLDESIRLSERAVEITPGDHPALATWLNNLGTKLGGRYKCTGKMDDLKEAIRVSQQAFKFTLAPPLVRIQAATQTLPLLLEQGDYEAADILCGEAIDILPHVHKRSLSLQDQQYVVSYFSGLAAHACSLALQTGEAPANALEFLERGRAVILNLLMDDRSDTSELRAAHPTLCARYETLRLEVNTPAESITPQRMGQAISKRRPKAIEELEECIRDIRQLPGFSSFQKGLTAKQMKNAADEGSIIIVNVTSLRSDAIVVSSTGFRLVPLPHVDAVQAENWVNQELTTASSSDRGVKNKAYREFLAWLWRKCVKPVLDEMDYHVQSSPENLPRVWWIGTGLASSFPFHAAGDMSTGETEKTYCRVLSSYTPSIKALKYARDRVSASATSAERSLKLLIVAMATTPGDRRLDLPSVKEEKSSVVKALGSSVHVEILDQPDAASVMRQIHQCNIAHFACHGRSDSTDPSQSGLVLQSAGPNPRQDILTVRSVYENHQALGGIAYLSACSTAENRANKLVDEVLHVVSGFQVAGFRHVIGSLWESNDDVCLEVATSFYAELCRKGTLNYTDRDVAMALHKAVSEVSGSVEYRKRPLHWAQYVHYGA